MNAQTAFANTVAIHCDLPCPATQDAIDRIIGWGSADNLRPCHEVIEAWRTPRYDDAAFNSDLLSAWKAADIKRATGQSRDWWLNLQDEMQKAAKAP